MYKVYYYITNKLRSKTFPSMHEAVMFAIFKVGYNQCGEIIKVKE